jgi:hypothetical protein
MCMSLPFGEDQPVFHVRTGSSQSLKVVARVQLEGEHLAALAKYLLHRAMRRKRVVQLPDQHRKAS